MWARCNCIWYGVLFALAFVLASSCWPGVTAAKATTARRWTA